MDFTIFVCHYKPLKERREFLDNQFKKHKFEVEYVTEYDREELTKDDLVLFDTKSKLKLSEISIAMKHIECYRRIVQRKLQFALIFEDDVILDTEFCDKVVSYLEQVKQKNWNMLYIGSGWNLHVPSSVTKQGGNVFLKSNRCPTQAEKEEGWQICGGSTRCFDSYFITHQTANVILEHFDTVIINKKEGRRLRSHIHIHTPIDHHMNSVINRYNFKVYWAEPSIVKQGSERGQTNLPETLDGSAIFPSFLKSANDFVKNMNFT